MKKMLLAPWIAGLLLTNAWSDDPDNLLINPRFDSDLAGWDPFEGVPVWSSDDAHGLADSGAMAVDTMGEFPAGARQCVNVEDRSQTLAAMDTRYSAGSGFVSFNIHVIWYSAPSCAFGASISHSTDTIQTNSSWQRHSQGYSVPETAVSARFSIGGVSNNPATVQFDNVYFGPEKLFSDRFDMRSSIP